MLRTVVEIQLAITRDIRGNASYQAFSKCKCRSRDAPQLRINRLSLSYLGHDFPSEIIDNICVEVFGNIHWFSTSNDSLNKCIKTVEVLWSMQGLVLEQMEFYLTFPSSIFQASMEVFIYLGSEKDIHLSGLHFCQCFDMQVFNSFSNHLAMEPPTM